MRQHGLQLRQGGLWQTPTEARQTPTEARQTPTEARWTPTEARRDKVDLTEVRLQVNQIIVLDYKGIFKTYGCGLYYIAIFFLLSQPARWNSTGEKVLMHTLCVKK